MNQKKEYPSGVYFNLPREGAPDFVLGNIAINKEKFLEWINGKDANEKGYIYLDVLSGKRDGKDTAYLAVNNWTPKPKTEEIPSDNLNF